MQASSSRSSDSSAVMLGAAGGSGHLAWLQPSLPRPPGAEPSVLPCPSQPGPGSCSAPAGAAGRILLSLQRRRWRAAKPRVLHCGSVGSKGARRPSPAPSCASARGHELLADGAEERLCRAPALARSFPGAAGTACAAGAGRLSLQRV
nr:PREDICTED: uncharacterized protein LOC106490062 isoform X3 [Apteryx mantelli mantelli]